MNPSKNPYRELFERSADAILIIEGNTFVECNEAAARMLRYSSREEVLSSHPSNHSPPVQPDGRNSYEKAEEMIAMAFERGSHRFEWTHKRADGEIFPVEVLLTAVEEENRRVLHVVWRDITERKLLEKQLRHAQKMEAVGKLAGGIAHDFNNLLVVILGHADLLAEILMSHPGTMEHIAAIQDASQRAAGLVQQLLAFGKKQHRLPEVLDLNRLVEEMRQLLDRLIGEDLFLETRLSPEPLPVKVDPGQIEQVIMNLVSNARDASPGGGTLVIKTSCHCPATEAEEREAGVGSGPSALLTVSDSGTGMDPSVVERAFDPFFTTKEPGRGTGLGLATVYGIVQQSQGSVSIESRKGIGTTVRVRLPLSPEPLSAAKPAPAFHTHTPGGTERIMLVEDEEIVRRLMVSTLESRGYEILTAGDGQEGLEVFLREKGRVSLIISDVIMPRVGGPEMVTRIRSRGYEPRVLFVSGYADDALTGLYEMGGSVDFLEKPFSPSRLAARVRRALDRESGKDATGSG